MSWRIGVLHRTAFTYGAPVLESYNEARMTPISSGGQQTLEARLDVNPAVRPLRYVDYWGTVVHAFDVHVPHTELTVTATSIVETTAASPQVADVGWRAMTDEPIRDRFTEYLLPSPFVLAEPELVPVAEDLAARYGPAEAGRAAAAWARDQLVYTKGATGVRTTSAEARELGRGVCQDYAHLTIALTRAMGLPSRYVSGYLSHDHQTTVEETTSGESHAWVEYWAGAWLPVDPTSLDEVAQRHIVVARGRDYADVRPLSGVYHGPHSGPVRVTVELTRLR